MILRMENVKFGSRMGIFMKAIRKAISRKVKESFLFIMVIYTRAAFKEPCFTATVCSSSQMAILTKEITNNVGGVDKECSGKRMVIFITVLGKILKGTEKVNKLMQTVHSMKAAGKTIKKNSQGL